MYEATYILPLSDNLMAVIVVPVGLNTFATVLLPTTNTYPEAAKAILLSYTSTSLNLVGAE